MQNNQIQISGNVVFWTCAAESAVSQIKDRLTAIGEEQFVPGDRTPFAALKRAAAKLWRGEDYQVQTLKDAEGITVEKITRGETSNDYRQIAYATLNADQTAVDVVYVYSDQQVTDQEWRDAADAELNICSASVVGAALARAVETLDGIRLRKTGGVYFLCQNAVERFAKIAECFEASGIGGVTMVHRLSIAKDDQAIRAVHETVTNHIHERVQEMRTELSSGLKKAGRRNRVSEIEILLSKTANYEAFLEVSLSEIRAELAEVQTQMSMETVAASADLFADQFAEDTASLVA